MNLSVSQQSARQFPRIRIEIPGTVGIVRDDPMERLHQQLTIDGVTVQEAKAGDMIHSLWELIEYGSSIITLHPGDVLNSGTSSRTSSGAFAEDTRSGYLQPGEVIEATIEGVGTIRMPVVAGKPPASDLSGAELPPVNTCRDH